MAAAGRANPRASHEDGMDILKFFIAIMSFLTVLVAGMAGYNWSRAGQLEQELESAKDTLDEMTRLAGNKEFLEMIAKDNASKDLVDVLKKDLGEHLQQTASRMGISFTTFEKQGAQGFRQQGFDKISYKFTLDKLNLDAITEFLFYLQLSWPGLKIEDLTIAESRAAKKDDPFPGWKTTVLVSIFRPKGT